MANTWLIDPDLVGSQNEVKALERWKENAAKNHMRLCYIAGHASSPESELREAGGLDFDRLTKMDLPELVILNGCWTGASRSTYGRDPLSLAVRALIGGAQCTIAGTGPIGSEASPLIGSELLRELENGLPVIAALRNAQIKIRNTHPDAGPLDWAGLIAVG